MRLLLRSTAAVLCLAAIAGAPARAQSFNDAQRGEIERIVKDYLVAHPEVLQEAMSELEKRQSAAELEKQVAGVKQNKEVLFNSTHQVTLGNPKGDVTMVEFFDYNCGYCKKAMGDMLTLLETDPKLKVVLKEYPVLGPGSLEAAQVAVAARMQDKTGKKYLDFHQRLLGGHGTADKARALAAAKDAGFDMARLEKDMASDEVRETLKENMKVADAIGLNGTPSYIIGSDVVIGAQGYDVLKEKVDAARK
ncbi:MAG: thioredoxin domain-containing protein [Bradyrhizobiaceae bacterium]|nr:thioredoxin domain-containing protein [Hyphomicrobiales bacterium]MBV9428839.1 thioredoxin domain-containing protein [Bradyrhizobiaceae bacterium]